MRALVIGFGSIGQRHARNLKCLEPSIELIAIRSAKNVQLASTELGEEVVTSIEEGLARGPDLVVIASPSAVHIDAVKKVLGAGIPAYIEKPLVTKRDDLNKVAKLLRVQSSPPVTFAGCNLRLLPSILKIKEVLQNGLLGNVVRASLEVGQWLPDWRPKQDYRGSYSTKMDLGGGVILDLIHELDIARYLFGEFTGVKAYRASLSSLDIETEDVAVVLLKRSEGGPLVTVSMDYVSRKLVRRYQIIGDRGSLYWDLASKSLKLVTVDGEDEIKLPDDAFDVSKTYKNALAEFVNCVKTNTPTSQDIYEGIKTTELALQVIKATNL